MATDIEMPDASKDKVPTKELAKESTKPEPVDPLDAVMEGKLTILRIHADSAFIFTMHFRA